MKKLSIAIAVFAAAILAGAAEAAPPVKNIVLVHGAFADGSSWDKVVTALQAKGFNVTAVQNPLTSLADDVATTKRALALQDGPVILVGHSWGGAVITEAGVDDKVVGLVYVSAFAPDVGETLDELGRRFPPPPAIAHLTFDKQGFAKLSADAYVGEFMPDVPKAEARVHAVTQGPLSGAVFATKFTNAAWKTRPSWYVVAKQDHVISPDLERFFAKRMNAKTTEVNSSHVPMISQTKKVVNVIVEAASNAKVAVR